jgi:hypothetical protein
MNRNGSMSTSEWAGVLFAELPLLLSKDEVAAMLRVHRNTLTRWGRRGFGPPVHVLPGGGCRYRRDELLEWLRGTCTCGAMHAVEGATQAVRG